MFLPREAFCGMRHVATKRQWGVRKHGKRCGKKNPSNTRYAHISAIVNKQSDPIYPRIQLNIQSKPSIGLGFDWIRLDFGRTDANPVLTQPSMYRSEIRARKIGKCISKGYYKDVPAIGLELLFQGYLIDTIINTYRYI